MIYQSEVIDGNLNPEWKPFSVSMSTITGGDLSGATLFVDCYDKDTIGKDFVGRAQVS